MFYTERFLCGGVSYSLGVRGRRFPFCLTRSVSTLLPWVPSVSTTLYVRVLGKSVGPRGPLVPFLGHVSPLRNERYSDRYCCVLVFGRSVYPVLFSFHPSPLSDLPFSSRWVSLPRAEVLCSVGRRRATRDGKGKEGKVISSRSPVADGGVGTGFNVEH